MEFSQHFLLRFNKYFTPIHELPIDAFFIGTSANVTNFQNLVFLCKDYKRELYKILCQIKKKEDVLLHSPTTLSPKLLEQKEKLDTTKDEIDVTINLLYNLPENIIKIFGELSEYKHYNRSNFEIALNEVTERFLKKHNHIYTIIDELLEYINKTYKTISDTSERLNWVKCLILNLELTIYISPRLQDILNELYVDKLSLENVDSIQNIDKKILVINDTTDERVSSDGKLQTKINMFHLNETWFNDKKEQIKQNVTIDTEDEDGTLYDIIIHNNPNNEVIIGDSSEAISDLLLEYKTKLNPSGLFLTELGGNPTNSGFSNITYNEVDRSVSELLQNVLLNSHTNYSVYRIG